MRKVLGRLTGGGLKSRLSELEQARIAQEQQLREEMEEKINSFLREIEQMKTALDEQRQRQSLSERDIESLKGHIAQLTSQLSETRGGLAQLQQHVKNAAQMHAEQLRTLSEQIASLSSDVRGMRDELKREIERSLEPSSQALLDIVPLLERALEMASKNEQEILRLASSQQTPEVEEPSEVDEPVAEDELVAEDDAADDDLDQLLRRLELEMGALEDVPLDEEVESLIEALSHGRDQWDKDQLHKVAVPEPQVSSAGPEPTPLLSTIPKDVVSLRLCLEWVEFLMEMVGRNNLPELLDYYVELGWISEEVEHELLSIARGIDYFVEKEDWKLSAEEHLKSYWFVRRIAGRPIARSELRMLKREMEIAAERLEQRL